MAVHSAARPSDLDTARAILPATVSNIQTELNMLHSSVYTVAMPLNIDSNDLEQLFPKSPHPSPRRLVTVPAKRPREKDPPSPLRSISGYSPPSDHDYEYCDPRLKFLRMEFWTTIPIGNEFAARVLSHSLIIYHAVFGCVDSDLFISDLVEHSLNYCSTLLVHSMFAFACVCSLGTARSTVTVICSLC